MRCAILGGLLGLAPLTWAEQLPIVEKVEYQPLAAQVARVIEALDMLGEPLPAAEVAELQKLLKTPENPAQSVARIQAILDRHCLVGIEINPESRVKAQQGQAPAELVQQGWRTFLIKVHNEAGMTAALAVFSPQGGSLAGSPEQLVERRFLDIQMLNKQPLKPHLSGLELEYRILQLFSRDAGKREARLIFDVGQGTQDLGFRSQVDILFTAKPAAKLTLKVLDEDGKPTTAAFVIRDGTGRVYPSL